MTSRIKVLHIISSLMNGGAEAMLSKVARASAKLGIDHVVISMVTGGFVAEELKRSGIPIHFLDAKRSFSAAFRIGALKRVVRDLQPDMIQGWMYHGNLAGTVAASFSCGRRIPVIWNVRQSVQSLRNETVLTALFILAGAPLTRTPRRIIYNSLRAAEDHERFGYSRGKRIIIPNGFDTELFQPKQTAREALREYLELPKDALIVGRVANFHVHKDYPTLFAAFAKIAQKKPRAHLVLVGRGLDAENAEFATLLASAPSANIHVMGERTDIARIMPGFDLLLSSSSAEAFPNVIGEAMACGVPAVTTDAGDCSDILGDSSRIVARRNAAMLAEKALDVLSLDREERAKLGSRDRARVIENYSIDAVAARYTVLWQQSMNAS
jgi:glycosyltransferase involved in cell wall biosynthesis